MPSGEHELTFLKESVGQVTGSGAWA